MVFNLLAAGLLLVSLVLCVPALIYSVECLLGAIPTRRPVGTPMARPAVAILVPAHDEETGIAETLGALWQQLRVGDRLVVVADNCSDDTAAVARQAGAEVVERFDTLLRGKGYALDAGRRYLAERPCPFVLVIDADCILDAGGLDRLVFLSFVSGQPVQARNLMGARPGARIELQVAQFAFLVKNLVRPTGLARLGLPTPMQGTGMVIPWQVLEQVELATGDVVEDIRLGFDLAQLGYRPVLCPDAGISSYFPISAAGATTQRQRWEGGHLASIWLSLGYLTRPSTIRTFPALVLLLDRLVPPLTLLILILSGWSVLATLLAIADLPVTAAIVAFGALALVTGATLAAWWMRGRTILPVRSLAAIPVLMVGKLQFYALLATKNRPTQWVRTDRGK